MSKPQEQQKQVKTANAAVILDPENAENMSDSDKALLQLVGGTKDGLENLIASLGTNQDKRFHSRFVNSKRLSSTNDHAELDALYQTNWVAGKIVEIIPDDMTREWRRFTGDIEPKTVEMLTEEEERLELSNKFNLAHTWARLYGTAYIIIAVNDGLDPSEPLDVDNLKKGSLRHLTVIDRHRMNNTDPTITEDPFDSNYGLPEHYSFVGAMENNKIHHSRVIRFDAVKLPFDLFRQNNYCSNSVLDRLYEAIIDFTTATSSSVSMIHETNVDIVKVKGLMNYLMSAEGEAQLRKRFALASQLKSFNNMMLMDNEEEYQNKTNTFASLPDLIEKYGQICSAGGDVPATRLLGTSAMGLNATGKKKKKNYYDRIASDQVKEYKPKLNIIDVLMAKNLGLSDDVDLTYKFTPLFQLTEKEIAETQLAKAQRDDIYLNHDVINEVTVAKELQQDETYTNITDEDLKELEEFIELQREAMENNPLGSGFGNDPNDPENENPEATGGDPEEGDEE